MTPQLLRKVNELVKAGATVVGARPLKSPSLNEYPRCDEEVKRLADELWGTDAAPAEMTARRYGKGRVICGSELEGARGRVDELPKALGLAKWVWHKEGDTPSVTFPPGKRYFRRVFALPPEGIEAARLVMAADDYFDCWVNGRLAGCGFVSADEFDVTALLRPGTNLLAVATHNGGELPNSAGLLASLTVRCRNGQTVKLNTDANWESALSAASSWNSDVSGSQGGSPALELGPFDMEPWSDLAQPVGSPYVYPEVAPLGKLLARDGLPPDFAYETEVPGQVLRYTHRLIGGTDVYFVANKTPQPAAALCSFRVQDRRPEFWWPDRGVIERPAVYNQANGCTQTPIRLEPNGSVFVVFRERAGIKRDRITSVTCNGELLLDTRWTRNGQPSLEKSARVSGAVRRPDKDSARLDLWREPRGRLEALAWQAGKYVLNSGNGKVRQFAVSPLPPPFEITGPWEVRFTPGWGAPERVHFDNLISWSEHSDPGVRFFSGSATYLKSFEIPKNLLSEGRRLFLDLGEVQVMTEVKLNGKALGILWKPPFRVEITDTVKADPNALEVKVINLWINRMIGDEHLPEDSDRNENGTLKAWPQWLLEGKPSPTGRFSFTTWPQWKKDDPLQKSGLIGPVKILSSEQIYCEDPGNMPASR